MSKTAIIIGAGPAGLTAAKELLTNTDIKPIILEESNDIGGISKTVSYNGNRMDLGGHRFFSKDKNVMNFWSELMPLQGSDAKDDKMLGRIKPLIPGGPDPEKEDVVMLTRQRVSRILFLRKFFDYPISLKFSTMKNLGFVRLVKAGFGYIWAAMFKRPENTLQDFMINRFGKPLYGMFFEDYNIKLWGKSPAELAPDWGAQRIKGLSMGKAIAEMLKSAFGSKKDKEKIETSLIEEFWYPKKGPGQLWELLAENVVKNGAELQKNTKVTKLNIKDGNISSVVAECDGKEIELTADYYISTMPIKDLVEGIQSDKPIPEIVTQTATTLPYRDFITVGLLVPRLKLVNKTKIKTVADIVPDCWIYIQERDVKIGRLQIFNNWSPYLVEDYKNKVFIGLEYFCNEGDEMWNATDEDFIKFAESELVKIDVIEPNCVLDATRVRVKKAYPAYFGSYSTFPVVKKYLDTIDNLYCIGRNGQHRYNNMDHSMVTAMEAVKHIIKVENGEKNVSKEPIWEVNTEQEYHEIKQNAD
ncbi:MAG: NAD(P)/FAD-dependent oxidoreductase [Bacillota bacterium]|nr:NAD(P)/FAD-dependent oxidoreductase [Bacillota bacterium]